MLTYYKGSWVRSAENAFTADFLACDGSTQTYCLAERPIELVVPAQRATADQAARTITLRLVVRRSDDGHQTPILTSRTDLTVGEIAYRMSARWRQENYFKYAREHFALDALDSYANNPKCGAPPVWAGGALQVATRWNSCATPIAATPERPVAACRFTCGVITVIFRSFLPNLITGTWLRAAKVRTCSRKRSPIFPISAGDGIA